jgi:phenylalanine-4-hydroxylase
LQRFGVVGAKAMSSKKDFELYEAIRHLSILKEQPNTPANEIEDATRLVEERQKNLGAPSEMARLSRLHWWTVEYGLIGPMDNPKIYGAGLLSSIGESVSCLEPKVKKIPYSIAAADVPFDITTKQPQLFVCRDFKHLADVLEEFAGQMAFTVGGLEGISKAIECRNTATCEYSSGLQVSGTFTEVITDGNTPVYLRSTGPSALACADKQLPGHGRDYHREGFGSPIGNWKPVELSEGKTARLEFESGVVVEGTIENMLRRDGELLLITFSNCRAQHGERVLFDPAWGTYDMAVGETIVSVYNGAADKDAYNQVALVPKERTIKCPSDAKRKKLENLYGQVRDIRTRQTGYERLGEIWETQQAEHPRDWLLSMEIYEILDELGEQKPLKEKIARFLNARKVEDKEIATLIEWGFRLVTYHQQTAPVVA